MLNPGFSLHNTSEDIDIPRIESTNMDLRTFFGGEQRRMEFRKTRKSGLLCMSELLPNGCKFAAI
jgi:hypothetical protein